MLGLVQLAGAQDVVRLPEGLALVEGAPDIYEIQQGDTLWDISSKFLGQPGHWPRLWSINDYITNPHWIYPGNKIVFIPGSEIEPPSLSLEPGAGYVHEGYLTPSMQFSEGDLECGPDLRFDTTLNLARYFAPGYLEDSRKADLLGEVYKARTEAMAQGQRDILYLRLDDPDIAECGDVVTVLHRIKKRVRHPEGGGRYGALYRIAGEAHILNLEDDIATAVMRRSWSEVERGDFVSVRVPITVELEVDPPRGSIEGVIVARLSGEEAQLAVPGEVIFIDRGRADGVRVGNAFYVVERRDPSIDRYEDDPKLPEAVVARLVVVRVDENTSTTVVVESSRTLGVGHHVTQKLE